MIDGLIYGLGCASLLLLAVGIGVILNRLFGPTHPSITGGRVIGERLSERSAAYWHNRLDIERREGTHDRAKK